MRSYRVWLSSTVILAAIMALPRFATAQTVYRVPKPKGRGWSDGTVGGGYIKPNPNYKPVRLPDGQPDIQGVWGQTTLGTQDNSTIESIPSKDFTIISRVVDPPDGKIPYNSWGRAKSQELLAHYIDPLATCVPTGVPRQMPYHEFEVVQAAGQVLLVTEHVTNFRHIPLTGGPHLGNNLKLWMGDSRGHWEGNTLVIDVTNQNDDTWMSLRGDFHSDKLHVVERLTVVDADNLQYEATIEDPAVFEKPWKMAFPIRRNPKGYELLEENCAEANKSVESQIEAGRKLYIGPWDGKKQTAY